MMSEMADQSSKIIELIAWLKTNHPIYLEGSKSIEVLMKLAKAHIYKTQHSTVSPKGIARSTQNSHFETDQTYQLLAQVQAFKRLSRNFPVTPDLIQSTGFLTLGTCENSCGTSSFVRPPTMFRSSAVGKELVASAASEASAMAQEKEIRLKNRMQYRLEELKALPTNIVPSLKKKAHIEIKQLKLLELQKKLRSEIASEVQNSIALESSFDLDAYRRMPRHGEPCSQEVEDGEGERTEVQYSNHRRFLIALHYHAKEFKEFHLQRDKIMKKVMKQLQVYHREKEKRVQRQEEINKKARLKMLRNHDEEGYRKLLAEAKDERLNTLIKETDAFLAQMGVLVQRERGSSEDKKEKEDGPSSENSSKTYYTVAHSIQEEITSQPDMLVGGQLKEYQVQCLMHTVTTCGKNIKHKLGAALTNK